MRNEHVIELDDMGFNIFLEHAIEVLEIYEKQPRAEFERYFSNAKIHKKDIRIHLELMRRMKHCIKAQMDDLDEDDYILVNKESLKQALNGKIPKWLAHLGLK